MAKVRIRLTFSPETAGRLEGMRVQFGDVAGTVVGVDDIGDGTYAVVVEPFDWKAQACWNVQLRLNDRLRALSTPTLVALAETALPTTDAMPPIRATTFSKRDRDMAWARLARKASHALGGA